jgi:hypothetical protein
MSGIRVVTALLCLMVFLGRQDGMASRRCTQQEQLNCRESNDFRGSHKWLIDLNGKATAPLNLVKFTGASATFKR